MRPDLQGNGIGAALVRASIDRLRRTGAEGIVLLGEPDYYGKFDFIARSELLLQGVPSQYFLCLSLTDRVPQGLVTYHSAFEVP